MNNQLLGDDGLPLGFGMALAQNIPAFERFFSLSKAQRQSVIDGVHGIQSKEEMRSYVDGLTERSFQ